MRRSTRSAPRQTPSVLRPANPTAHFGKPASGLREWLYTVIFESDTRAGRAFDLALIAAILLSVTVVVLDSVRPIALRHGRLLDALEWFFSLLFTFEYCARLYSVRHPLRYATSFFGIIDLLSILPSYVALLEPVMFMSTARSAARWSPAGARSWCSFCS